MTDPHLLPLSTLHAAAPGVLDVVFGPDGDFEGAPPWCGVVLALPLQQYVIVGRDGTGRFLCAFNWTELALDLRIPSVAARLAGLCARALGCDEQQGWVAFATQEPWDPHPTYYALGQGGYSHYRWEQDGRFAKERCSYLVDGVAELPFEDGKPRSDAAFLAALTLALAPRIAALRSSR